MMIKACMNFDSDDNLDNDLSGDSIKLQNICIAL